ncbi:MAG: HEAT repeat domain-containing protein, partial [Phycisphaerae bacterium]
LGIIRETVRSQVESEFEAMRSAADRTSREAVGKSAVAQEQLEGVLADARDSQNRIATLESRIQGRLANLESRADKNDKLLEEAAKFAVTVRDDTNRDLHDLIDKRLSDRLASEVQPRLADLERQGLGSLAQGKEPVATASDPGTDFAKRVLLGDRDLPALLELLHTPSTDWETKYAAIERIVDLLPLQDTVVKPIAELLTAPESHPRVRRAAAEALGTIRLDPDTAVPALTKGVGDPGVDLSSAALEALAQYEGLAKSAIPAILRVAKRTRLAKSEHCRALLRIDAGNEEVIAYYEKVLQETDPSWDIDVFVHGLALYGPDSNELAAALLKRFQTTPSAALAAALGNVGGEKQLKTLEQLLLDEDTPSDVRIGAAWGISFIGGPSAVETLRTALTLDRPIVAEVAWGLGTIGAPAAPAVKDMVALAKKSGWDWGDTMLFALDFARIGEPSAVEFLNELLQHENAEVRFAAGTAIALIEGKKDEAVRALLSSSLFVAPAPVYVLAEKDRRIRDAEYVEPILSLLPESPDSDLRIRACKLLANFELARDKFDAGLLRDIVTSDPDPEVRRAAYDALMTLTVRALELEQRNSG